MSTSTLQNFRVGSDLTVKVRLKDGGVAIDWSTLSGIRAVLYSDAQSSIAGRCDVTVDGEDPTLLVCRYAATKMQYLGVNRIVVSAKYMGVTKTYDKPAFTFVRWTADQEGEQITIEDPEVTVEIDVEDVSSAILQEAVNAAFSAADRANDAAEAAEHMVDIHTGPAGKSPYKGENGNWFEWDEEAGQYVDTGVRAKGDTGETPDISIGTVTTVEPGEPAAASMTGTPEAPVLNLSIPKGLVGATPNFTVGEVTTGQPGTPVVITITGTAEAPVLNVQIPQGMKGDTGVSADYPITIYNGLDSDATDAALSAAQGKVLDGKISQLQQEVNNLSGKYYGLFTSSAVLPSEITQPGYAFVGSSAPFAIWNFDGTSWSDTGATVDAIHGEDGVGFASVASQQDGTIVITLTNGDTVTIDLNHNHPQYYSKTVESEQPSGGFLPDVVYSLGTLTGTVTFALAAAVSGNVNHYFWMFDTGSASPTVTWPTGITWADGSAPTVAASKHYEVSIMDGIAAYLEV